MNKKKVAFQFIVLMGVVSLLGDIAYEKARGVTGPYLAILGASASIVGLIGGLGDFIGYALRLLSGFMADRTKAYWILTFIGYGLLLALAVPLLAFANLWWVVGRCEKRLVERDLPGCLDRSTCRNCPNTSCEMTNNYACD